MQKYVTPSPGRTPREMITNRDDYKLEVTVRELIQNEYQVVIRRWIPETGWSKTEFFLDPEELVRFQHALEI